MGVRKNARDAYLCWVDITKPAAGDSIVISLNIRLFFGFGFMSWDNLFVLALRCVYILDNFLKVAQSKRPQFL